MYTDSLKSQCNSLKHQIDLCKRVHEADLRVAKEDFDRKAELCVKDRTYSISLQKDKIQDLERSLKEEKDRVNSLRLELASLESQCKEDLASSYAKKKILQDDLSFLTEDLRVQKLQIRMLQNELNSLEKEHQESMNHISSNFQANYSELTNKSLFNQNKIRSLENEIQTMQSSMKQKSLTADNDIHTLEEALASTYHTVELQSINIDKLKKATEESLKNSSFFLKQKNAMVQAESKLISENSELRDAIDKLERTIYGRSARIK